MNDFVRRAVDIINNTIDMSNIFAKNGLEVNRQGFIHCPFHNEKTASLKAYKSGKRFKCFGCGAEGGMIDFVMRLNNVDFKTAVKWIDFAFGLNLFQTPTLSQLRRWKSESDKRRQERQAEALRQKEIDNKYWQIFAEYAKCDRDLIDYMPLPPDYKFHPEYINALRRLPYLEYLLDIIEQ